MEGYHKKWVVLSAPVKSTTSAVICSEVHISRICRMGRELMYNWAVQRSLGLCLKAEGNPKKPHK